MEGPSPRVVSPLEITLVRPAEPSRNSLFEALNSLYGQCANQLRALSASSVVPETTRESHICCCR